MYSGKIFCVGYQKTGTSSLGRALEHMGYRVCGAVGLKEPDLPRTIREVAFAQIPKFDAFQDNPWPILFRELDQRCPGSKFILTRRDPDSWIASVIKHFASTHHPMQEWIYGVGYPLGNEQIFLDQYHEHNRAVLEYFVDRPSDLLVLDIESDLLWVDIAEFLQAKPPNVPFPHANKGGTIWKFARWLTRKIKRASKRLRSD